MADSFVVLDGEFLNGAVAEIWRDGDVVYAEVRIPGKPHVIKDAAIVPGSLVLDPHYTPPWPGSGITKVSGADPDS